MRDSATTPTRFETPTPLALEAAFDGGRLTSDGGLPWLAKMDAELGLCETVAANVPEWRRGASARNPLLALVRQRVYQVASGYEDQNDANTLRADPLLKLACGRLPETGADLASQPTLSRMENAPGARACYRIAVALGEIYLGQRAKGGVPGRVLLDLDSTDDPTHGMQLDTLRLVLVKVGGRVRQLLTKVRLHLASGHPGQRLWNILSSVGRERARE